MGVRRMGREGGEGGGERGGGGGGLRRRWLDEERKAAEGKWRDREDGGESGRQKLECERRMRRERGKWMSESSELRSVISTVDRERARERQRERDRERDRERETERERKTERGR